jgi:hypothetical protein
VQHFTRNTVSATSWCNKCGKPTMHRIDGVKLGPCLDCLDKTIPAQEKVTYPQLEMFENGRKES